MTQECRYPAGAFPLLASTSFVCLALHDRWHTYTDGFVLAMLNEKSQAARDESESKRLSYPVWMSRVVLIPTAREEGAWAVLPQAAESCAAHALTPASQNTAGHTLPGQYHFAPQELPFPGVKVLILLHSSLQNPCLWFYIFRASSCCRGCQSPATANTGRCLSSSGGGMLQAKKEKTWGKYKKKKDVHLLTQCVRRHNLWALGQFNVKIQIDSSYLEYQPYVLAP